MFCPREPKWYTPVACLWSSRGLCFSSFSPLLSHEPLFQVLTHMPFACSPLEFLDAAPSGSFFPRILTGSHSSVSHHQSPAQETPWVYVFYHISSQASAWFLRVTLRDLSHAFPRISPAFSACTCLSWHNGPSLSHCLLNQITSSIPLSAWKVTHPTELHVSAPRPPWVFSLDLMAENWVNQITIHLHLWSVRAWILLLD